MCIRDRSARSRSPQAQAQVQAGNLWLPEIEAVVDALVEASSGAPGGGSRLAY